MKSLATWLVIGAVCLQLLAPAPLAAAERKRRKDRDKTTTETPGTTSTTGTTNATGVAGTTPAPLAPKPSTSAGLKVIRPQPGEELTVSRGSTFVIGTVPSEEVTLRCNGKLCKVFAEGAFIGYVPIKRLTPPVVVDQKTMDAYFEFVAIKDQTKMTNVVYCVTPASPSSKKVVSEKFAQSRIVESMDNRWVGMENDALADAKPLLNLGKVVFFPKGSRIAVKEKKGDMLLVEQPIENGPLWIPASEFKETREPVQAPEMSTEFLSDKQKSANVYTFQTPAPVPMIFEETTDRITLRIRFLSNPPRAFDFPQPALIWGFEAAYHNGAAGETTVMIRFPPVIDKEKPFQGLKILLDPGHHPDPGALGPRGTEERAITLLLARQLADILKARGAEVTLSREDQPLELGQRPARFKAVNPDLVVSLHFNSVGDDEDPMNRWGTQTIYLYAHSRPLAKSIYRYLQPMVRGHDLSFVPRNLVVTRYPAVPVAIVESTHIIMPEEEMKLLTPAYRDELAKAIADGISNFLLGEPEPKR